MDTPIVLVHGFGGGLYEMRPIESFLRKSGYTNILSFTYEKKWGQPAFEELASDLDVFIRKNIGTEKLYLIGISQGGIIARCYAEHLADKSGKLVPKCVTLCTPHYGSLLAYMLLFQGTRQLRPQSDFMKKLKEEEKVQSKTHYYAVYNPLDLMVFPGTSANFRRATESRRVWALVHPLTFWRKPTLEFIKSVFKDVS